MSVAILDPDREITDGERARLLDHGMHEENIFYSRLNFFLIFESVLLGAVIQTATASGPKVFALQILALGLGIGVLLVWVHAQTRKLKYLKRIEARLADRLPEMMEIKQGKCGFPQDSGSLSANKLITYAAPALIAAAWLGVALALWL